MGNEALYKSHFLFSLGLVHIDNLLVPAGCRQCNVKQVYGPLVLLFYLMLFCVCVFLSKLLCSFDIKIQPLVKTLAILTKL